MQTSNLYVQIINLQDPIVDINDGTVSTELGLLYDVQREHRQTEHINVEANCDHRIPTTLNGKIYPKAVNELDSCATIGSPRVVNEVLENNLPLTGSLLMQTPNANKSMVVILSDSHLKGCTKKNKQLSE
jgi:hypothetical protein